MPSLMVELSKSSREANQLAAMARMAIKGVCVHSLDRQEAAFGAVVKIGKGIFVLRLQTQISSAGSVGNAVVKVTRVVISHLFASVPVGGKTTKQINS